MYSSATPLVAAVSFLFHVLFVNATPLSPNVAGLGPIRLETPHNTTHSLSNEKIVYNGAGQPIQQNVYLHVISVDNKTAIDDNIQDDDSSLNATFSSSGISFNIISEDHTVNAAWFNALPGSAAEEEMKSSLRRGGYADLNVYYVNDSLTTVGEACTLPSSNPTAEEKTLDGCSIGYFYNPLKRRWRPKGSFAIATGGGTVNSIMPEIGRWLAIDIDLSSNGCFDSKRNTSSLCVHKQTQNGDPAAGGPRIGFSTTVGISHAETCFDTTSPALCIDSTGMAADVKARMERAVVYGIGAGHLNNTTLLR